MDVWSRYRSLQGGWISRPKTGKWMCGHESPKASTNIFEVVQKPENGCVVTFAVISRCFSRKSSKNRKMDVWSPKEKIRMFALKSSKNRKMDVWSQPQAMRFCLTESSKNRSPLNLGISEVFSFWRATMNVYKVARYLHSQSIVYNYEFPCLLFLCQSANYPDKRRVCLFAW